MYGLDGSIFTAESPIFSKSVAGPFFDKWEAGWAGGIQSMPEIFTKNDIIVFQDLKALDSFVYSLTH